MRFRLFLELGQCGAGFDVADPFAGLMVAVRTCPERPVVNEPASPERPRQRLALLERWVKPESVTDFHTETVSRVRRNGKSQLRPDRTNSGRCFAPQRLRAYGTAPFIPSLKGMGFLEAFL